jgi:hypothetical protein
MTLTAKQIVQPFAFVRLEPPDRVNNSSERMPLTCLVGALFTFGDREED